VLSALAETDVAFPNEAEALALTGRGDGDVVAAAELLATMTALPVIKRGAAGALAWNSGARAVPAPAMTPVDTVGAGDSFNAGFLAARLSGRPMAEAIRWAAIAGSLSTRAAGGTAAQATLDELTPSIR